MRRALTAVFVVLLALTGIAEAQWLNHPDPRIPRTAYGKPILAAPAPRAAVGKPCAAWPDLFLTWAATQGFTPRHG